MDKFTAEIEPLPVPQPMTPPAAIAQPSGIPAFRGPPAKPGSPAAKPAKTGPAPKPASDVVEYAKEYRVNCHICGSLMYVKAAQAGKTIKCSDCHSAMTVPGPPRIKKSLQIDLDQAETFALEESRTAQRGPDPYQKSAQQLLDEAARVEQINPQPTYDDTPSVKEWFANVFGIFKDLGAVAHWIGLSVLASVPAVMAIQMDNPALIMALFPGGFFLGVLTVSCGFAILHSVANQLGSVEDWPTLNPLAWLGKLMLVVIAACLVAVPMWAICMFTVGPSLIGAAVTMMAIYVGFPFVLLSMLDMNSALVPFSPEVARSVTKCEEAWGGFYFSSGLLFVTLFLIFAAASGWNPVLGAVVPIASGIGATFIYFAMIGRLAYAIGQSIHAPPRKTDVAAGG
jgi:DNA-directed RNA polymerase subunit M/transcription elongation factor TFIIS